ncbi:MAG: esterase/lipase family protein [Alphaproteobacteria bacterium]
MPDGVVLLHGIFRSSWSMWSLAQFLARHGYETLNLDYASRRFDLPELAAQMYPKVHAFSEQLEGRVHFVGHSMGGLLARTYIHAYRPRRLGRVVMIGTPNGGSEVADKLQYWWLFRKLYGPAGQRLITDQRGFSHIFGQTDYDVGCIAGNATIDPIGSMIIGGENDGKVSVASTKLYGMKAHAVVPVSHTFLSANRKVQQLTLEFLQSGVMNSQGVAST